METPVKVTHRRKFSVQAKAEVLKRFEMWSGSREEFCRVEGVGLSTLSKWLSQTSSKGFIAVSMPRKAAGYEILLNNGRVIRVSGTPLEELIRMVEVA